MQVDVEIPDDTSLAKRAAKLEIALVVSKHKGSVDMIVEITSWQSHNQRRRARKTPKDTKIL